MFARLKLRAICGFILPNIVCYVLSDKTSENSAKKGAYQNACFLHFWTLGPLLVIRFEGVFSCRKVC